MPYPAIDRVLLDASQRLDDVRQDLYFADTNLLTKRRATTWRHIHGTAYVHLAACLEVSVKGILRALVDEINTAGLPHCDLRVSLFSLIGDPHFSAISAGTKPRHDKRAELFALLGSTTACILNNAVLPLDGRTMRPIHFDIIWSVFGLPLNPLPQLTHRLALIAIADARNDVAHGDATAEQVSRRQPISDTLKQVERSEEVLINLHTAAELYLRGRGFER
jgi:hypothetical protein